MASAERLLTAWESRRQRARLKEVAPGTAARRGPPELATAELDERLAEHLDPPAVRQVRLACERAGAGPEGEPARRRLRRRLEPYLAPASADPDRELGALAAEHAVPSRGFAPEIGAAGDPAGRAALARRWLAFERAVAPVRAARRDARRERARDAGAADLPAFLAAAHPGDPSDLVERFERGAIAPLDDAVEAAARRRAARSPFPAQLQRPELLLDHADRLEPPGARRVLRRLGAALGMDPDAAGPTLLDAPALFDPEALECLPPVFVLQGIWPGPGGLRRTLAALGRGMRAAFLLRERDVDAARWADPAFGHAAEVLFRRLVLSPPFLEWAGVAAEPPLPEELRLEESVAPREAWGYLYLAHRQREPDSEECARVLRRVLGREASPGELARAWETDPGGAAVLRGTVLALLLEDLLLRRMGRTWFRDPAAGRLLRDLWAEDSGQTAESVVAGLGLGTMEPDPILELCRP